MSDLAQLIQALDRVLGAPLHPRTSFFKRFVSRPTYPSLSSPETLTLALHQALEGHVEKPAHYPHLPHALPRITPIQKTSLGTHSGGIAEAGKQLLDFFQRLRHTPQTIAPALTPPAPLLLEQLSFEVAEGVQSFALLRERHAQGETLAFVTPIQARIFTRML